MKNSQLNNIEISKFLNNTLSPNELNLFKEKLEVSDNVALLKKFIIVNHLFEVENVHFDSDAAFEKFLAKKIAYNSSTENSFFKTNKSYLYAAAIALFVLGLSILIYTNNAIYTTEVSDQVVLKLGSGETKAIDETESNKIFNKKGEVVAVQKGNSILYNYSVNKELLAVEINEIYVPYGKRMEVVLSDGTRVYLNSGSKLIYPTFFNKDKKRIVELKGEAYFNVAKKDSNNRFVVNTKNFETTVLGTEFNISSYDNDVSNDVVLVEGAVSISSSADGDTEFFLAPGEQFNYTTNAPGSVVSVDVQSHIAWLDGVLVFENESFDVIVKKLERFYNVSIENNYDTLLNEKFTGQFDLESIEDVLTTFKNTMPFKFEINNQKVVINPLNS
ncbi:FecR family protein [Cellulophaga baltica]|uniref:FecR family protein n=1 Tax=Cellulophaga baltica TaxID=76594 RepID=A0A1G7ET56_9FLAO|nr:FecR domain-containing protein [Cellulophaga baltica]SDE66844.1 FecR family protein [Cellulophaga baltica]